MYVELHSRSAFSFLRGGSFPEQLAHTAQELGMPALGLCDRNGVYGAQRFSVEAKEKGIRPIIGAELTLNDGSILPVLVENRVGYQNLCRLLTRAHLRSVKGSAPVNWDELAEFSAGLIAMTGDHEGPVIQALHRVRHGHQKQNGAGQDRLESRLRADEIVSKLLNVFGRDRLFVEVQRHHVRGQERIVQQLVHLADSLRLPLLATNGVLHAIPSGRQVLDIFTCIRHHTHLDGAGTLLTQNAERHLKSPAEMAELFKDLPQAIANTSTLADRLQFRLADLGYEFPSFPVAPGETMDGVLRQQAIAGAIRRYGHMPEKVRFQMERELALIEKLRFAGYFLIVADLVRFCRENDIMSQGRGSAANSTVCFCLGVTAVDPLKFNTLFERFLSEGRKSWPDIDIDLPSGDRRERVIQEVYRRYGKHGAAMTANVISYRGRSAAREIGKALNFPEDVLDRFSNLFANGDFPHTLDLVAQMEQAGLSHQHPRAPAFASLYQGIYGLPRHLGQHSGGMIISQGKLDSIVPLENASMPGRVVAQWDKDDCEGLGMIKVDLLGLGMMSVLQDAIRLTEQRGHPVDLAKIPEDDAKTFELMQQADTIGVFQIESRAQMATLPRMKPISFYDVCIEVAIIRPGPIQGHLMHPYLARRNHEEPITYYHESLEPLLKPILQRTLGVPLFQEQMLEIAMTLAGFDGSEAEELRRALSFHRSEERMNRVVKKLRAAMEQKNLQPDVIENIIKAIGSFALYGFPESHAISFALLAYGSAYLKAHRAPEFYASLLNNQPMGFYSPATIVKDAKRHGVKTRPVCLRESSWLCTIGDDDSVRLGFCVVQGLRDEHAAQLIEQRNARPFDSIDDLKRRTRLNKDELRTLAELGALNSLAKHRRDALWRVEKQLYDDDLFSRAGVQTSMDEEETPLDAMNIVERLQADFRGMHLTTGPHPMALLRPKLPNVWRAGDLIHAKNGQIVQIAGNVICRQRPGTAKGFVFISLEDETGISNAIVTPALFEKLRLTITQENFLLIEGKLQSRQKTLLVQARKIEALPNSNVSGSASHDFH